MDLSNRSLTWKDCPRIAVAISRIILGLQTSTCLGAEGAGAGAGAGNGAGAGAGGLTALPTGPRGGTGPGRMLGDCPSIIGGTQDQRFIDIRSSWKLGGGRTSALDASALDKDCQYSETRSCKEWRNWAGFAVSRLKYSARSMCILLQVTKKLS